jgi:hypothetical protein
MSDHIENTGHTVGGKIESDGEKKVFNTDSIYTIRQNNPISPSFMVVDGKVVQISTNSNDWWSNVNQTSNAVWGPNWKTKAAGITGEQVAKTLANSLKLGGTGVSTFVKKVAIGAAGSALKAYLVDDYSPGVSLIYGVASNLTLSKFGYIPNGHSSNPFWQATHQLHEIVEKNRWNPLKFTQKIKGQSIEFRPWIAEFGLQKSEYQNASGKTLFYAIKGHGHGEHEIANELIVGDYESIKALVEGGGATAFNGTEKDILSKEIVEDNEYLKTLSPTEKTKYELEIQAHTTISITDQIRGIFTDKRESLSGWQGNDEAQSLKDVYEGTFNDGKFADRAAGYFSEQAQSWGVWAGSIQRDNPNNVLLNGGAGLLALVGAAGNGIAWGAIKLTKLEAQAAEMTGDFLLNAAEGIGNFVQLSYATWKATNEAELKRKKLGILAPEEAARLLRKKQFKQAYKDLFDESDKREREGLFGKEIIGVLLSAGKTITFNDITPPYNVSESTSFGKQQFKLNVVSSYVAVKTGTIKPAKGEIKRKIEKQETPQAKATVAAAPLTIPSYNRGGITYDANKNTMWVGKGMFDSLLQAEVQVASWLYSVFH